MLFLIASGRKFFPVASFVMLIATAGILTAANDEIACGCCEPAKTLFQWSTGRTEEDEQDEDTIETDRPDFTEASSTVGRGRVQLEMGYTFTENDDGGVRTTNHSYPELLIRIGTVAEWFELRIGSNVGGGTFDNGVIDDSNSGMEDLYVGCKIALTEQSGVWPEMALMPQMQVPTGHDDLSADQFLPGLN